MAVGFPAGPQKLLHLSILLVPSLHIVFKEKRVLTSQLDSEALERDLPCGAQDSARRWAWHVFPLPTLLGDSVTLRKTGKHLPSIPKAKMNPKSHGRCFPTWVLSCFRSQSTAALPQRSLDVYIKL